MRKLSGESNSKSEKKIPIFFATNDGYVPYLTVAMSSMLENASKKYFYDIHVLTMGMTDENKKIISNIGNTEYSTVEYVDLNAEMEALQSKLAVRDYYSKETYCRFFIARLFPQYDKVIYLDADIVVKGDVSELYNTDLGSNYLGAVHDHSLDAVPPFAQYVENVLGVPAKDYFNAGILLINSKLFRKYDIEKQFVDLLNKVTFDVAQDQDYMNVICQHHVHLLDWGWNRSADGDPSFGNRKANIVHYNLNFKPWKLRGVQYENDFWAYAEKSVFHSSIKASLDNYSEADKARDEAGLVNLIQKATLEANDPNSYYQTLMREKEDNKISIKNSLKKISKSVSGNSFSRYVKKIYNKGIRTVYGSRKK